MYKVFVINGLPGSGTRLLYDFIEPFYPRVALPAEELGMITNLKDIDNLKINYNSSFKTHSRNPTVEYKNVKTRVLYLFANVINSAIGRIGGLRGIDNPGIISYNVAKFMNIDSELAKKNAFEIDVFDFIGHFKNWNKPHKYPVLMIRYEALYSYLNKVLDFLELPKEYNNFPTKKERRINWKNHPKKELLLATYGEAMNYLDSMPDLIETDIT